MHEYYITHPQLYTQAQTRDVRHILVKTKPLAESLFAQLKAGNDKAWCTLAKKYSQDPSSKDNCGKLTVSKGQTVPEFDKVAFAQPTKVRSTRRSTTRSTAGSSSSRSRTSSRARRRPRSRLRASIKQQLLQQNKNQAMTDWVGRPDEELLLGLEDQVPGRLRADAGSLRADDDERHDHRLVVDPRVAR